jgi:hypothetical protein
LLNSRQSAYLKKKLGATPEPTPTATQHTHPISAILRAQAEEWAVNDMRRRIGEGAWIADIGGNPQRNNRPHVHCISPTLDASDSNRRWKWETSGLNLASNCTHRAQECECHDFSAFVSVHCATYYITPHDIAHIIGPYPLYAVTHRFSEAEGHLHAGELFYESTFDGGERKVRCQAEGNSVSYYHSALDWMDANYWTDGHIALTWTLERVFGDNYVYLFRTVPLRLAPPMPSKLSLVAALSSQTIECEIDVRAISNTLHTRALSLTPGTGFKPDALPMRLRSLGAFLGIADPLGAIVIPKNIVSEVAQRVSMKPRNADTFSIVNESARRMMSQLNLRPQTAARALPYVMCLGFVAGVDVEIDAIARVIAPASASIQHLNSTYAAGLAHARPSLGYRLFGWIVRLWMYIETLLSILRPNRETNTTILRHPAMASMGLAELYDQYMAQGGDVALSFITKNVVIEETIKTACGLIWPPLHHALAFVEAASKITGIGPWGAGLSCAQPLLCFVALSLAFLFHFAISNYIYPVRIFLHLAYNIIIWFFIAQVPLGFLVGLYVMILASGIRNSLSLTKSMFRKAARSRSYTRDTRSAIRSPPSSYSAPDYDAYNPLSHGHVNTTRLIQSTGE